MRVKNGRRKFEMLYIGKSTNCEKEKFEIITNWQNPTEISSKTAVSYGDIEGTRTDFLLNGLDKCITAMLYPFTFVVDETDYLVLKSICKRKNTRHTKVLRSLIANFVIKDYGYHVDVNGRKTGYLYAYK